MLVPNILYVVIVSPILFKSIKTIKANEALVLVKFGKYYGTLKGEGSYLVNPFVSGFNPSKDDLLKEILNELDDNKDKKKKNLDNANGKCVSLKMLTLDNGLQKVNDKDENPIDVSVVVTYKVENQLRLFMKSIIILNFYLINVIFL